VISRIASAVTGTGRDTTTRPRIEKRTDETRTVSMTSRVGPCDSTKTTLWATSCSRPPHSGMSQRSESVAKPDFTGAKGSARTTLARSDTMLPGFAEPELPVLGVPVFGVLAFEVPDFDFPDFDLPVFDFPDFDLPVFVFPVFELLELELLVPGVLDPGVLDPGVLVPGVLVPGVLVPGVLDPGLPVPGLPVPGLPVPPPLEVDTGVDTRADDGWLVPTEVKASTSNE